MSEATSTSSACLLEVNGLRVAGPGRMLVDGVSVSVQAGKVTALCGPSGAGKSVTARACMGLVDVAPGLVGGTLRYPAKSAEDWYKPHLNGGASGMRRLASATETMRGGYLSYSPQAASSALNPGRTIGRQMQIAVRRREGSGTGDAREREGAVIIDLLREVGLAPHVMSAVPGELSGGMCQRAALAIAMASDPQVLLADEPETGLDPVLRRQVVELLLTVGKAHGCGILLISHHEDTVTRIADSVVRLQPPAGSGPPAGDGR